jgi:hypothetical protein
VNGPRQLVADALAGHRDGRVPNLDQIAGVTQSTISDGSAKGMRVIDVQTCGGWSLQVLPDRGLDLGAVAFAGVPVSWTSAVGPARPIPNPTGDRWLQAFSGGLVTTCGLQNVGAPSEGHGLHGRYSHLPAREVRVRRDVEESTVVVEVTGTLDEVAALGPHLRVERGLRVDAAAGTIDLTDVTTNLGDQAVAAPLLYHVNLGAPLWSGDARLTLTADHVEPRDEDAEAGIDVWDRPPPVAAGAPEWVLEHRPSPDAQGWAYAEVTSPHTGVRVRCSWDTTTLPRLHQWIHRRAGVYALAIEPANCSTLGRAADRAAGTLPHLAPREVRVTRLRLGAAHL